ncbi:hypothetical protein V1478_013822 [Vespula squamosa]|uniref:Uncharacterized protein n=1 Tax=Vespula squamosa TaxID=30214 RepID=A0ABD2A687_VESSQ
MFAHPSSLATGSVDVNDDYNNTGGTRLATQPESSCCPAPAKLTLPHIRRRPEPGDRDTDLEGSLRSLWRDLVSPLNLPH